MPPLTQSSFQILARHSLGMQLQFRMSRKSALVFDACAENDIPKMKLHLHLHSAVQICYPTVDIATFWRRRRDWQLPSNRVFLQETFKACKKGAINFLAFCITFIHLNFAITRKVFPVSKNWNDILKSEFRKYQLANFWACNMPRKKVKCLVIT